MGISWFVKTVRSGKRYPDGTLPAEVWKGGQVSPTLNAFDNSTESRATVIMPTDLAVRRLTPIECERLQGFPDNWTDGQADSHRYKQMGNAVAVPVVSWIVSRIREQSEA